MDVPASLCLLDQVRHLIRQKHMNRSTEKAHVASLRLGDPRHRGSLRLKEALMLRKYGIDPTGRLVIVKDRATMPAQSLVDALHCRLERIRLFHRQDLESGFPTVWNSQANKPASAPLNQV